MVQPSIRLRGLRLQILYVAPIVVDMCDAALLKRKKKAGGEGGLGLMFKFFFGCCSPGVEDPVGKSVCGRTINQLRWLGHLPSRNKILYTQSLHLGAPVLEIFAK